MIEIKTKEEFSEIINNNDVVVIDFKAEWCGPCKVTAKNIESIEPDFPYVKFIGVNIDDEGLEDIVAEHGIRNLPTMAIYRNHVMDKKIVGLQTKEQLVNLLKNN